jgi:hypothetical protein
MAPYAPRASSRTGLYQVIAAYLETFLALRDDDPEATGLPAYVRREFYDYLPYGILAHGFLWLSCDTWHKELLLPFSCSGAAFASHALGAEYVSLPTSASLATTRAAALSGSHRSPTCIPYLAELPW